MQSTHVGHPSSGRVHRRHGFTLIELIVSLTVISVATTILLKLYLASTALATTAQNRELAATVAEGKLAEMAVAPAGFVWELENPDGRGLFRVRQSAEDPRAGRPVEMPDVLLPFNDSFDKQEVVYDRFRWSAFGRVPSPTSAFIELSVDVQWTERGETKHIVLTSAVSRAQVDPEWPEE